MFAISIPAIFPEIFAPRAISQARDLSARFCAAALLDVHLRPISYIILSLISLIYTVTTHSTSAQLTRLVEN